MYKWADRPEVFPDEQHGFRVNRSTETAISVLQNIICDILSEAKIPLYVAFVDFAKAFDSIDRTLLFGKLQCCGISKKIVKVLWPLINENYVKIISGRNIADERDPAGSMPVTSSVFHTYRGHANSNQTR